MHKTDRSEQARPAVGPRLDGRVRALREGEVMGAYMDFDRTADRAWTPAEYLVRFGEYVSQRTAEVNNGERPAWRFVGLAGCKPYLTQRQYEAQTPGMQQWYEPLPAAGDERSNHQLALKNIALPLDNLYPVDILRHIGMHFAAHHPRS